MTYLYGNHVLKAHLAKMTEDTPEHQGVIIYSSSDIPMVQILFIYILIFLYRFVGFCSHVQVCLGMQKLGPNWHCSLPSSRHWRIFAR